MLGSIVLEVLRSIEYRRNAIAQHIIHVEDIQPALQLGRHRHFTVWVVRWNLRVACKVQLHLLEQADLGADRYQAVDLKLRPEPGEDVVYDFAAEAVRDDDELVVLRRLGSLSLLQALKHPRNDGPLFAWLAARG